MYKLQEKHIIVSLLATVLNIVVYAYLTHLTNSLPTNSANNFMAIWSPLLLIVILICLSYFIYAAFKVHGWPRVVPLVCTLINLLLFCSVLFFYVFTKMYTP